MPIRRSVRPTLTVLLAIALAAPSCARAQQTLTLQTALVAALRANADVVLARLRVDSAAAELHVARALPNPTVQTTPGLPSQYGVSLPLDIGPQRWARVRVQRLGYAASASDVADVQRLVRFAVRQAYVDAQLAESLRRITADERDVVRQFLSADSTRLRAGDIPARNVARTELELARSEAAVRRAEAGVRATRLALQIVIGASHPDTGLAVADTLGAPDSMIVPVDERAIAIDRRADVRSAVSRVEASRASASLARAMLLPTPQLAVIEQPAQPFASGRHEALALTLSVPLFNQLGGERDRAAVGLRAAQVDVERRRVRAATEVAETADSMRTSSDLVGRYRSGLLSQADSAVAQTRYAYSAGAATLTELLDAVRTHVTVRAEYATAVHDYWVSAYAYLRATGTEPASP